METIHDYETLEKIIQDDLVVVIAKTKTCNVCKPLTEKLKVFMDDYPTIPAYQLYLEDVEIFQGQHLVFTVPTIIVFSESKEILRESRFIDFSKIERLFQLYIN